MRGLVCGLTLEQVRQRALYLAGETTIDRLDWYVRKEDAPMSCPTGYYLLKEYNGGKDPTAPDPFARWKKPGSTQVNVTADCIGGAAWCGGFDRFQEKRFAHIYGGWINTDSMIQDASGPAKCFELLDRPLPGCFVVFKSGDAGHAVGHIGTVVDVPLEWDPNERECWKALGVVDVASRVGRANKRRDGSAWFRVGRFIQSVMRP